MISFYVVTGLGTLKRNNQTDPNAQVPTHREIQIALVEMGDKEETLVDSNTWLGAFEVSLCMEHFLDIESQISFVQTGADLKFQGPRLRNHFQKQGTPVMIGGDVYAYTILGIDFDEDTSYIRFLILDPHYTGTDTNIKTII